ncbi:phosphatidic acid phosphatase type 2/haloperoxidase [Panaeolus papilionaceus]|nr:phosphatidic acid phosphatase type 2/haloperoxidase [Panaeolus papilionaceus]
MSSVRRITNRYFGEDSLDWFDRSYFTDWIFVLFIWMASGVVSVSPVYERSISFSDPTISHPQRENQVGSVFNHLTALFIPLAIIAVAGATQRSLLIVNHGALGVCLARGLARLVTVFLKHSVGRLRPDFLSRCSWDEALQKCTGKAQLIIDGRKSFPSGHSSTAFSGMLFLSLWIAGQTAAWAFSVPKAPGNWRSSRLLLFSLTLIPLFWATRVAISRVQDFKHHKEDVVVGSLIGIISALISYYIFWPSPFSVSSFESSSFGQPRILYTHHNSTTGNMEFELTRTEEELNAV